MARKISRAFADAGLWAGSTALVVASASFAVAEGGIRYAVVDGVSISEPLDGATGDAERGKALFLTSDRARCAGCHTVDGVTSDQDGKAAGAGPALDGVGLRLSQGALRLWIVNPAARVADSAMPAFYSRTAGLRPGAEPREAPILTAQEIEDLVRFLDTLGRDG